MGGSSSMSSPKPKTPEQIAQSRYERGLRARDKALGYEKRAAESDTSWFGKIPSEKAVDQWEYAVASYEDAIEQKPRFYQAYSDMGYALRKLGRYDESIAAYDRALRIRSDYAPAIEYRGEAYLRLLRLSDAKDAYMRLFQIDRELAAELMESMTSWLADHPGDIDGLDAAELQAFRGWVRERADLAGQAGGEAGGARGW